MRRDLTFLHSQTPIATNNMARPGATAARGLSSMEELEMLEQSITLTLQGTNS